MLDTSSIQPITVHGSNISYFTGKIENYFRVREIRYTFRSMSFPSDERRLKSFVGVMQMPAVELGDGRWMTDTTKTIEWFESQYPENRITPDDPVQAYLCALLEDWADEWWWRPAMHYRWHYPQGAALQGRHLAEEVLRDLPLPLALRRFLITRRQRGGYTTGDGITPQAVPGIEAMFKRLLDHLEAIFSKRPFVFGTRPSLADVGLSGPFFRHFALDPVPLEIIRQRAPSVLEWVSRLWNTRIRNCEVHWDTGIPDDLGPLFDDIGSTYLPYLRANSRAVASGSDRFDVEVGGVSYLGARHSRYRIWCLQELRNKFEMLPEESKQTLKEFLQRHDCWESLWLPRDLPLLPSQEARLPFFADSKMIAANS